MVGQLCPNKSTKAADQFEIPSDYEHMVTQSGDGVGLTLDRNLYMQASRDLGRARRRTRASYNTGSAYAPPRRRLHRTSRREPGRRAAPTPTTLTSFY